MKKRKLRLYGKRATQEEIIKEILRLLRGDREKGEDPLSVGDIADRLGFVRSNVYCYTRKAAKAGLMEYDNSRRLSIPTNHTSEVSFRRFNERHQILKNPLVAEWKQDLLTRKQGEALSSWKTRLRYLESVCNTCKIKPKKLLTSRRQTENILKNYVQLYLEGRADKDARGIRVSRDIKNVLYARAQAIRDFCGYHGLIWKRGTGGVMSVAVPNHGLYADIRLTDAELEEADRYIISRWGLDSDVYRWFWIGVESCSRFAALYSMRLDYAKHTGKSGRTTYIMTAFESKTKNVKRGKWVKYITRADTQKSIDLLKARGVNRIFESKVAKYKLHKQTNNSLKEIYRHLGKSGYFEEHPTHALRHIGAHYWLAKKNYNYGLVALIGGWNTIDELKKSYGEIPPEAVLEMIENDSGTIQIPLLN
ncbi:MAG: helix-turn-helix domain-containing protein [Nitrosotalea sp.]